MFIHIETSQLICKTNQLTTSHMVETIVVNGVTLRKSGAKTKFLASILM